MTNARDGSSDTLPAGTQLGPYQLVGPIGRGGMGTVYRGRDVRLGRDVAVKVLAPSLAADPQALERFRQEAQAASALNHPNIVTVYDVGVADEGPFIVTELLEGETLRAAIERKRLTPAQALECIEQVATGLAAAHSQGILHRDIKPENLFRTSGGTLKILDFGLAKLTGQARHAPQSHTATGLLMGTAGYVSPEQIRDQAIDHRSDIFSLGVVLYEALTGLRPFRGGSLAETLSSILGDEPPQVSQLRPGLTAAIDEVVRGCLEKDPVHRFDSAADLARTLRAVSRAAGRSGSGGRQPEWVRRAAAGLLVVVIATLAVAAVALAGFATRSEPTYRRVTFARATIPSARFRPDSNEVIYDAIREDHPRELFATVPGASEVRSLGIRDAELLAISASGDLALSLNRRLVSGFVSSGTLAIMTEGRAPREVIEDVHWADWSSDGASLAIVREVRGRTRLEFPVNTVLFETSGWISDPRFSPDGKRIAFVDHPLSADDRGHVMVSDLSRSPRVLSPDWLSVAGLAWSATGSEVWFTAQDGNGMRALRAVDLDGGLRTITNAPGRLRLLDISRDGRVLLARDDVRLEARAQRQGDRRGRNLSWFDWSLTRDLSNDGSLLVMTEFGEAVGSQPGIYLRKMDGSTAVRLGTGSALALAPSGQSVLAIWNRQLRLLPVGAGDIVALPNPGLSYHPWGSFFRDGRRVAFTAAEPGRAMRVYVQDLPNGLPTPITPEGFRVASPGSVSPAGDAVLVVGEDERLFVCPADGGEPRLLPGALPGEMAAQWQPDGRGVFLFEQRQLPARVFRLSLDGGRELVGTLAPDDLAGAIAIHRLVITPDAATYAYTFERQLSDIYVATGFPEPPLAAKVPLLRTLVSLRD